MKTLALTFLVLLFSIAQSLAHDKNELYTLQQYDELIEACTPPTSHEDYIYLAQAYKAKGDVLEALKQIEASPDTAARSQTQQIKADLHFSLGHYNASKSYYLETIDDDASFYKLMQVYENTGNYMQCITKINARIDSSSTNVTLLTLLADSYYQMNAMVMARQSYNRIYTIDSMNTSAAYKLAYLLFKEQKEAEVREALSIVNSILDDDASNIRFLRMQARILYLLENYREALYSFERLYKAGYNDESTMQKLGFCEYKSGFCREAIEHLMVAYLENPVNFHTNMYLGMSHQALGNYDEAMTYLDQAELLLQPSDEQLASICWERQWCYIKNEEYQKADSCLHQLLVYSDDAMNYYHIASNYDKNLKNKNNAIAYYQLFITKKEEESKHRVTTNSYIKIAEHRIKQLKEDKFWGE